VNPADYLSLHFTNSDGHLAAIMNVHHSRVGEKIIDWMTQQAAGEVLVKPVFNFGKIAQVDP